MTLLHPFSWSRMAPYRGGLAPCTDEMNAVIGYDVRMAGDESHQSNTLGKASLLLGILSSFSVFSVGLCAGVGQQQGWLKHVGVILFVIGASFAFLGLLSMLLGLSGLFGKNRSRATAIVGFTLGLITVLLFLAIVNATK